MKQPLPNTDAAAAARRICETLSNAGYHALLAGGCVRDLILGHEPKDYDIATAARPEQIRDLFPRAVDVGAAFGVMVVVEPEGVFEVATFRVDGPYDDGRRPSTVEFVDDKADASRRDFTINALYLDPVTEEVIDYVGGCDDIARKIVRTVGDPHARFQEDHLRLLRAVRFAARLDYALDENTAAAMREMAALVTRTSAERIGQEVVKLLTEGGAARGIRLMDETGLLEHVLPEIKRMQGIEQPPEYHPEGDVYTHTLLVLDALENPTPTLALAALLHDVGKPLTQTFEDRIRFNHHDKVGAQVARRICKRLRLSNFTTDRVVWLVEQHMRIGVAQNMRESKVKRLIREPGYPELRELHRVDCLGSHRDLNIYDWLRNYEANLQPEHTSPPPLITGETLKEMGYTPGPKFREILTEVEDAQLEGRLTDAEAARAFVSERWPVAGGPEN